MSTFSQSARKILASFQKFTRHSQQRRNRNSDQGSLSRMEAYPLHMSFYYSLSLLFFFLKPILIVPTTHNFYCLNSSKCSNIFFIKLPLKNYITVHYTLPAAMLLALDQMNSVYLFSLSSKFIRHT